MEGQPFTPMAGLYTSLRTQPPSSATNHQSLSAKLLLLLTVLPLSLALFAFFLQWRGGGIDDPISRWSPDESLKFPGMDSFPLATLGHSHSHSSDCSTLLGHSNAATFPYYRDRNFKFDADLKPKICITTSTPASLEQILPWMFYHEVIGVSTFFLFVEGKAASPAMSRVLESIPAFIIASTATEEEMLNWYREHVVWTDTTLNLKLLRKGILTRIYAPMTIIQGLRESSIFGSVIASAQGSLSTDKFLASVESSNSFRAVDSVLHLSRKMGRNSESQATARKALETTKYTFHEVAVPPLSPPVMEVILKHDSTA